MTNNPKESPGTAEAPAGWSTETARIVAALESQGIGFRLSGDEVYVRGWRSLLRSTRDELRAVKPEVIALLQARAADAPDGRRIDLDRDLPTALCEESRQGSTRHASAPSAPESSPPPARRNPWRRPPLQADAMDGLSMRALYHQRRRFAEWARRAAGGRVNTADPYEPRGTGNPGPPPVAGAPRKPPARERLEWERRGFHPRPPKDDEAKEKS